MRADMFEILIERPRWGSRHATAAKLKRSNHDIKFIGHSRHVHTDGYYSKSLNENLAPLIRFLWSRRGRRWDDVFSEICAQLDTGSTVKMHVREHLDDFVLRLSYGRYGELMPQGHALCADDLRWRRWALFIDPDDGVLKDLAELRPRIGGAR